MKLRFRASRAAALLACCLSFLSFSCAKPPTKQECDALLDHYVEMLVNSDRPGTSAGELHKLQLLARDKAKTDPEFAACSERVSRHALECALSAPNADELEQCLL
jgi:hypothetical protein